MPTIHTIRLRDPWEVQTLPDGRTEHRRKFGKPRERDHAETVWLVCPSDSTVLLNGEAIPAECEVTTRLQLRNEVAIVLNAGESRGEVQLEIRTPD